MNPAFLGAIFALLLAIDIIALLEVGRRIGVRRLAEEGEAAVKGFGALARFDARRNLVVAKANEIATAFLRIEIAQVQR